MKKQNLFAEKIKRMEDETADTIADVKEKLRIIEIDLTERNEKIEELENNLTQRIEEIEKYLQL